MIKRLRELLSRRDPLHGLTPADMDQRVAQLDQQIEAAQDLARALRQLAPTDVQDAADKIVSELERVKLELHALLR